MLPILKSNPMIHFPNHIVSDCKKYIDTLDIYNWPEETLRIDGVHILQIWTDKGYACAGIINTVTRTWSFIKMELIPNE